MLKENARDSKWCSTYQGSLFNYVLQEIGFKLKHSLNIKVHSPSG